MGKRFSEESTMTTTFGRNIRAQTGPRWAAQAKLSAIPLSENRWKTLQPTAPVQVIPKSYTVYLYLARDLDALRRRWKYLGSTSRGGHRFFDHLVLGEDGANTATWFRNQVLLKDRPPNYLTLERADSVKDMQMLEFIHEYAQRKMGESLVNERACGAPCGSRNEKFLIDKEFTIQEWPEVQELWNKRFRDPVGEERRHFEFMKNLRERLGGFNEELEREMALFAVKSVTSPAPAQIIVSAPAQVSVATAPIPETIVAPVDMKAAMRCSLKGCTTETRYPHNKLCRKHEDWVRRICKKLPRQERQAQML